MEEGKNFSYGYFFRNMVQKNLELDNNTIVTEIENYLKQKNLKDFQREKISTFVKTSRKKWKASKGSMKTFTKKNSDWLDKDLLSVIVDQKTCIPKHKAKSKEFENLSESQKKRRTKDLTEGMAVTDTNQILFATSRKLRSENNRPAANLMKEMAKSPGRATKILDAYGKKPTLVVKPYTADEALALIMKLELSRDRYNSLRESLNKRVGTIKMLPDFNHVILKAKKRCYPPITVSEKEAFVNFQEILHLTTFRLLESLSVTEEQLADEYTLFVKWGFDGSSGHTSFKQSFSESGEYEDGTIFTTSFVPLLLRNDTEELWKNPAPNSSSYCRPIRIAFEKEENINVKAEYNRVTNTIDELQPFELLVGNSIITVNFKTILSMLDQKAINVLEENAATTVCYICGCKPSFMNDLKNSTYSSNLITDPESLQYGISPLHAWINFFEFLLHLSYRLELPDGKKKKYSRTTTEEKTGMAERKAEIQSEFRKKLGLIVDVPKAGFGNSNDGNTARRFFENPDITADITGINRDVIERFKNILIAINTSQEVDPEKFRMYALETAKKYVEIYNFYQMSPTIHKVLLHGADIIQHCVLPVGLLSEECQEASHKYFKIFRQMFSRKTSRKNTMTDIMNRFLIFSDPLIRSKMGEPKRKHKDLPNTVIDLLAKTSGQVGEKDDENTDMTMDLF